MIGVTTIAGLGSLAGAEPLGPDVATTPDTLNNVGLYTSLALDANGYPVISYQDATEGDLKVLHCTNADCSGTQTPTTPDTSANNIGLYTSLALDANGYPVISYQDATTADLKVLHCTNADCSGIQTPTSPDTGNVGQYTSLTLDADGYPVISYRKVGSSDLSVLHCTNADCSGTQTPTTPDTTGSLGFNTSIVLDSNGYPVISYYDNTNDDLKVLHCTNPDCSGTQTPQTPDTSVNDVGQYTSLALDANGYPVISYYDTTSDDLKVLHCTNPNCSGTQTPQTPDTGGNVGQYTSLALDTNGYPVISYYDTTNNTLKVLHCTNPNCSGTQTPTSPDTSGNNVGWYTSLTLDAYGNPVVSYRDFSNGDLKVLHCYDTDGCGGQDQDLDGIAHSQDNCAALANANQANNDGDSQGDACDSDDDNDNVADTADNCAVTANADQADADNDNIGDACDPTDGRIPNACSAFQGANVIIGTNAGETLTGTAGRDVILGLGGDDILIGLGGDDCILGGPGDDIIRGKAGNDTIRGQKGADTIRGNSGNDNIRGGSGADNIRGGSGNDNIRAGSGSDIVRGQRGADTIRGQRGADTIRGGSGSDILLGGSGNDDIFGQRGNDTINGGSGSDSCNGGPGTDTKTRCEN